MALVIPQNTTVDHQRFIRFFVGTLADPLTPKTTGVAGENARLQFGTRTVVASDNAIVAVDASGGYYGLELSDSEAETDPCTAAILLNADDIADIAPVLKEFELGPADSMSEGLSDSTVALEVLITLAMGRGHKIVEDGTDIVLLDTDLTTELARVPRTRAASPKNVITSVGGS